MGKGNTQYARLDDAIQELAASPARFINRELSWLAFNTRVLEEACSASEPLLERLKFLSISGSNLDEFYMVRVAGLKQQLKYGVSARSADGLTPTEQLERIHAAANQLLMDQQKCWNDLREELAGKSITVLTGEEIEPADRKWLEHYFFNNIFAALSPLAIDPAHPFPFLPNLSMALVLQLQRASDGKALQALVPLPSKIQRFIRLPGEGYRFIPLEEVVLLFLEILFPNYTATESGIFRILRDSDLEIEEEAEDLVEYFEMAVKRRRRGSVIRLKAADGISPTLLRFVTEKLGIAENDVVIVDGILGTANLSELYSAIDAPELKYPPYKVRYPERIRDFHGDCFAAIEAKDIVIHHPYESFDVVVQFLQQAAHDPDVISIKQTLYRTSNQSPIVAALIEAAENGKAVTALVELKARFDEEANIKWARNLERAGVHVIYGFVNLKTHTKISLVTRRCESGLKSYVHFGTGNYHPITARFYTDLSFFTCNAELCRDASFLFNYLTGYTEPKHFNKLMVSPFALREKVIDLIDREIIHAKAGRPANIWIKCNALTDPEVIDALYRASQHGVKIDVVVRGICALRPGIKGFSDNIRVKSIVGRFLEHARIYCFGDGHALPAAECKVFISSADMMPRNYDGRVEVMVPIENETVHEQILGQIMVANLKDTRQSWVLHSDGAYARSHFSDNSFSAHEYFMTNPSLSGRGKALRKGRISRVQ